MTDENDEADLTEPGPDQRPDDLDGGASDGAEHPPAPAVEDRRGFLRKLESLAFLTLGVSKLVPSAAASPRPVDDACGDPASSGGYWEDLACTQGGTDNDCGKKAMIGWLAAWADNDCLPPETPGGGSEDNDCGKKAPAGATHSDLYCAEGVTDSDCGRIAPSSAGGGAWNDSDCNSGVPFGDDSDCGKASQGNPSHSSEDQCCTANEGDKDCGVTSATTYPGAHEDNLCGGPPGEDNDCGISSGAPDQSHSDSDCAMTGADNTCTNPANDIDRPLSPNPPDPPGLVL
jgi:hypothetical protein